MMHRGLALAGATCALLSFALTYTAAAATITLVADGDVIPLATAPDSGYEVAAFDANSPGEYRVWGTIGVATSASLEPLFVYGLNVQDWGAGSTFAIHIDSPIDPVGAPGFVDHTHSSSTTDAGADGVTVTALAPTFGTPVDGDLTTEIVVYALSTNGGTTLLNVGHDLQESFFAPGTGTQPGLDGNGPGPAATGAYDHLTVEMNFSVGGGGDRYTLNGNGHLVPEPGSLVLLGAGLAGLVALRRRTSR